MSTIARRAITMTIEEYRKVADEVWKVPGKYKGKKECEDCVEEAKNNGDERPPMFPSEYEGNCPRCGGRFRQVFPG